MIAVRTDPLGFCFALLHYSRVVTEKIPWQGQVTRIGSFRSCQHYGHEAYRVKVLCLVILGVETTSAIAFCSVWRILSFVSSKFDHTGLNQLFGHLGNFPNQLFETIQNLWP